MVIDQTCKRLIDEKKTTVKGIYDGIVYYFCSEKCKEEFRKKYENYKNNLNVKIISNLF